VLNFTQYFFLIFIVVPCILITLKFLSPTNAPLCYTYKMLKYTVKISPTCFGPPGPSSGSLCRTLLKLQFCGDCAEHLTTYFYWLSPQNCNFSKVRHRLPDDGPGGPKHVEVIMRYFNCIF